MGHLFLRTSRGFQTNRDHETQQQDSNLSRAVLEATPDGVITVDEDLVVRALNRAAAEMFGYQSDQAVGLELNALIEVGSESDWQEYQDGNKTEVSNGCVAVGYVGTGIRCDGRRFAIDLDLSRGRFESGAYFTAVVRDISPGRRPAEATSNSAGRRIRSVDNRQHELDRASEELARTKEHLQQLAHVASHDLQEPLRMVGSYCELLERRYADTLDDKAKQFLHFAVDGALRMRILIEGMLKFSRIETEARPPSMVEAGEIANEVISRLSGTIARADAEINLGPLPLVFADEAQLDEVLFQLLSNALKFRKPDDQLSVDVTAEDSDNEWIFTVRDNGLGLNPEHSDKIFGLFQRVANGDHHEGSGLGLGLCKRIVERHRGRIWVRSEPGFGSAFYFALPKPARRTIEEADNVGECSTSRSTLLDEVLGKTN